jgi:hypothetical protein
MSAEITDAELIAVCQSLAIMDRATDIDRQTDAYLIEAGRPDLAQQVAA